MPRARAMQGVLAGFLGIFTSRYSDFNGYWVCGFLVEDLRTVVLDLKAEVPGGAEDAFTFARGLAIEKFGEQARKHGFVAEEIDSASVSLSRLPGIVEGFVNGRLSSGYSVSVIARAQVRKGRQREREQIICAAPHNPAVERRSSRAA